MNIGTNPIGFSWRSGFSVFANYLNMNFHAIAVTIDWSTVTAETGPRTLPSGYTTVAGDKVIPAGSVLYKITSGATTNSLYGLAVTATTLVKGETFVNAHDIVQSVDLNQIGPVADHGNVITAKLQVGNAGQPTLANLLAACPGFRPFQ